MVNEESVDKLQNAVNQLIKTEEEVVDVDLQRKLSSQGIRKPVIVIWASDDVQTRERARKLGAAWFLRKPVDGQALNDAIHWAMGVTKNKSGPSDS